MTTTVYGTDYYISAANGKGKKATKEAPANDLGDIVGKLSAGDKIHIAGGVYLGRSECGSDSITVPVTIIGGYDEAFSKRDPWGETKTIFSGLNKSKNQKTQPRLGIDLQKYRGKETGEALAVLVDGIIVDNGDRNRYSNNGRKLERKANPKAGENPSPESAGILVKAAKFGNATVQNCIVINCAPTTGALSVWGSQGSKCIIRNNLAVNNTGSGLEANSWWHPRDGKEQPIFTIENNTVLFSWKHDPFATYGGNGIQVDSDTVLSITGNVFAFSDIYGMNNAKKSKKVRMADNLFTGNLLADYLEFDTKISVESLEDEAEYLSDDSSGNITKKINVTVDKAWAEDYGKRNVIDRNAAEADVKVIKTRANELRTMLGLPLQAANLSVDSDIWLHRMKLDDAIASGSTPYFEKYGSRKP